MTKIELVRTLSKERLTVQKAEVMSHRIRIERKLTGLGGSELFCVSHDDHST